MTREFMRKHDCPYCLHYDETLKYCLKKVCPYNEALENETEGHKAYIKKTAMIRLQCNIGAMK